MLEARRRTPTAGRASTGDAWPTIDPLDAVDQHDPAGIDFVAGLGSWPARVDGVIDNPVIARASVTIALWRRCCFISAATAERYWRKAGIRTRALDARLAVDI